MDYENSSSDEYNTGTVMNKMKMPMISVDLTMAAGRAILTPTVVNIKTIPLINLTAVAVIDIITRLLMSSAVVTMMNLIVDTLFW